MGKNNKKKVNKFEVINNFWKKHWFWYTVIIALPTVWFSVVLPFLGTYLKLQDEKGITVLGGIISLVIVTPIAILVFINNFYSSMSEKGKLEKMQGEIAFLGTITENVDAVCDEKYNKLKNTIVQIKEGKCEAPQIITNPNNQLHRIIKAMTDCLSKFLANSEVGYNHRDFLVSIAYNFPQENRVWEWVEGMNERDLTLEELLSPECDSTFQYLIKSKQPYYYKNKKEDAKREHHYFYSKQDEFNEESGDPVGSIFCYNFKLRKGEKTYVNAYLSISTNKKRFSVEDPIVEENTKDNMISLVRDTFGKRINIELSLLYLEYLWNKQHEQESSGMDIISW